MTEESRFWSQVNLHGPTPVYAPELGPCWIFLGRLDSKGYGRLEHTGAHRYCYELRIGLIPDGKELDHLCRVPSCVNPEHLEPVTRRENLYRSPIYYGNKDECTQGHSFTPENTYTCVRRGYTCRVCRTCSKNASKRHYNEEKVLLGQL